MPDPGEPVGRADVARSPLRAEPCRCAAELRRLTERVAELERRLALREQVF